MSFLNLENSPYASTVDLPRGRSLEAPKVYGKALSIGRMSFIDLPIRFRRSSTPTSIVSESAKGRKSQSPHGHRRLRKTKRSQPPPPVPPIPPITNVHFDSLEFITLDPEPWVSVNVDDDKPDFGLPKIRLTHKESLLSMHSFYSKRSFNGDGLDAVPSPRKRDDSSYSTSPVQSMTRSCHPSDDDDDPALCTPPSGPSSPIGLPRTNTLPSSKPAPPGLDVHSYLPEFRHSLVFSDAPAPPRPPRRRPTPSTDTDSESIGAKNPGKNGDTRLPLIARRLASSSASSSPRVSTSSRPGSAVRSRLGSSNL